MQLIQDQTFTGERPLYLLRDAHLDRVTISTSESSVKETANIRITNSVIDGYYAIWECRDFNISDTVFKPGARASLWYNQRGTLTNCRFEAPKIIRRVSDLTIDHCDFVGVTETLWDCDHVTLRDTSIDGSDYLFLRTNNIFIDNYRHVGKYAFQYSKNVEIHNAVLDTKDAFWESENVTIYDSTIKGQYLAWYAKNLRLVRCHIDGEQPLCYCDNLVLEDCTMGPEANLAFEYCTVHANIKGHVVSVKNPTSGSITADSIGEIILDGNAKQPADCVIKTNPC